MNQKVAWLFVLAGLGLFGYQLGEILMEHSTWSELREPAGVGEIVKCGGGVLLAVLGALGVKVGPSFLGGILGGTKPDGGTSSKLGVVVLAAGLALVPACSGLKAPVFANPTAEQVQDARELTLRTMNAVDTSLIISGEVLATADALQRANRLTANQLREVTGVARTYARAAETALKELKAVGSEPARRQTVQRLSQAATPYIDKLAISENEGLRAFAVALRVVLGMTAIQARQP